MSDMNMPGHEDGIQGDEPAPDVAPVPEEEREEPTVGTPPPPD